MYFNVILYWLLHRWIQLKSLAYIHHYIHNALCGVALRIQYVWGACRHIYRRHAHVHTLRPTTAMNSSTANSNNITRSSSSSRYPHWAISYYLLNLMALALCDRAHTCSLCVVQHSHPNHHHMYKSYFIINTST